MTDKEFKRLNRSQLIEIIYQFQIREEELTRQNQELTAALDDKRLRITRAGNIAEAALEVNNVMQAAQNAAQQYLDEIQALYSEIDGECQTIREKAQSEADAVMEQAKSEAAATLVKAQAEAAAVINWAQTEAATIIESAVKRWQTEAEIEKIFAEYGDSFRK